jgi:ubiquinone biosynthesis protein UbiJ
MCKQGCSVMPSLADICADEGEMLAVSVSRFIAAAHMTSDAACWDAAYNCAETILGADEGPLFVARIAGLMRALRAERSAAWHFLPAPCCRLTGDEQALVDLLALARGRHSSEVDRVAARIAGVEAAPRLVAAARAAAVAIERAVCRLGAHQADFAPLTAALH